MVTHGPGGLSCSTLWSFILPRLGPFSKEVSQKTDLTDIQKIQANLELV